MSKDQMVLRERMKRRLIAQRSTTYKYRDPKKLPIEPSERDRVGERIPVFAAQENESGL